MSYDLYILPATKRWTADQIQGRLDAMENGESWVFGEPTSALESLTDELNSLFDANVDESPLASAPIDSVDGFIAMNFVWSTSAAVIAEVVRMANSQGFCCFDPQDSSIYYPDGSVQKKN
ncbi:MAG: hypothetical protein IT436_06750 [Phycisphaerales bacterium]|nr:hypothetical protein [Phycisphaerales bacterium]